MISSCAECGSPAETYLCPTCIWRLSTALGDLPGLLSDLAGVAMRQAKLHRTTGRPRAADEDWRGSEFALIRTPWALNVDAAAELARIGNELAGWVRHICEGRGVEIPAGTRVGVAQWLYAHLDSIALDEAAAEILTEMEQHRFDLMRAVDNSPSPFFAGPCHALIDEPYLDGLFIRFRRAKCERDLYAWVLPWGRKAELDRKIVCKGWRSDEDGCGTVHTVADRQDWLLDAVEDALLPLETWRRSLPKMIDSLTWPHASFWSRLRDVENARRVVPPRSVAYGVELFRGGDLVEHVRREQGRIAASIAARAKARDGRMSA